MMGSDAKERTVMEVEADGVALITIIHPPVNALSFNGTFYITPHFLGLFLFAFFPRSHFIS
jgi:enoyl-CoA hydratase/3-hydroxyacyl-CoA dehydrogenase